MQADSVKRIGAALRELARLAGVPVLWRYPPEMALPQDQYHHCNPFCMAVKRSRARHARCSCAESTELAERVARKRTAFAKTCHAGAVERVVPLMEGAYCHGVLIAGPYRRRKDVCPYVGLRSQHQALPIYDAGEIRRLEKLLAVLADHIQLTRHLDLLRKRSQPARDRRIAKALTYIHEHFRRRLCVREVAAHCALSPSRFVHLFPREVGVSYAQYLAQLRVAEARELLMTTDQKLAQVAEELGFADQSHFGAVFKGAAGTTPRQFRLRWRRPQGV